jgi:tetratricopeptide (TPR) repeat protein
MTELSATFVLLGIVFYLHGRKQLSNPLKNHSAYIWMSMGLLFGTIFSMLSKENGILILLYILIIEKTILNSSQYSHHLLKHWQFIFIKLPIAIVVIYLFYKFDTVRYYQYRNFSLSERLITENAVVFDYLRKIIAPSFNSFSLYYDDFPISKKLTDSYQTLFGFLFIASSIVFSFFYRKRFPFICFGFLWYYSGHLLESTFIPLELYFEHRNYLPLLGITFVIVVFLYKALNATQSKLITASLFLCTFFYISYLPLNTYVQTNLWGTPYQAKLTWALEKPNSTRAQSAAANVMAFKGNYQQALKFTKKIIKLTPNDPSPYLAWLQYRCHTESIPHPNMSKAYQLARQGVVNFSSIYILNEIVLNINEGKCNKIKYQELSQLFQNFEQNKNLIKHADFYQIYSMMEGYQGHYIKALNLAERSLSYKPNVSTALFQLRWLVLLGDYHAAYQHLEKVKNINKSLPKTSILFKASIKEWEDFILKQLSLTKKASG